MTKKIIADALSQIPNLLVEFLPELNMTHNDDDTEDVFLQYFKWLDRRIASSF